MGVPTSEVGYTAAMPRREDHEVHRDTWWHWGHVVALGGKEKSSKLKPMSVASNRSNKQRNIPKIFDYNVGKRSASTWHSAH